MNKNEFIEDYASKNNQREVTEITVSELRTKLVLIDGESASTFWMVYKPDDSKIKKTGNPFVEDGKEIGRISRTNGHFNVNYTSMVNNQLEREGKEADFEAFESWMKKRWDEYNGCIGVKKDGDKRQEYFCYSPFKENGEEFLAYLLDDEVATDKEVTILKTFKSESKPSNRQGTQTMVLWRSIKLQNILYIQMKGKFYKVVEQ